jgi:RsiW-degrading membrane proteinase PrsW (M82 family)
MIRMQCPNCGRDHEFSDALAGLVLFCKGCSNRLAVPPRSAEPDDQPKTADPRVPADDPAPPHPVADTGPPPALVAAPSASAVQAEAPPAPVQSPLPSVPPASRPPVSERPWLKHLHWLLVLALIPLALSLLRSGAEEDFATRLDETLDQATPEQRERALALLRTLQEGKDSVELLFDVLPGGKLGGALLPRHTLLHWALAAGSAVGFLGFFLLLARDRAAEPRHLLAVGLFTATVGIVVLLLFQLVADLSQGVWLTGGNVVVIVFYLVKFVGYSYRAALDPESGFFLSFVGYTLGVGLCEEVVKALPLFWLYRRPCDQSWRGAFLWGLASGAGFGIAEGIIYSASFYNGISGPGMYLVRFISCVALHAVWTGSVAITLNQKQELIQQDMAWYEFIVPVLRIVGVPMVLHGLYDTLLKKEMNGWALAVAVLSFGFLAYQISRLHGEANAEVKNALGSGSLSRPVG